MILTSIKREIYKTMTLDEAIIHCYTKAKELEYNNCISCSNDHIQLAKWLEELKEYRTNNKVR